MTTKAQHRWTRDLAKFTDIAEANIQISNQSKTIYKLRAQVDKMHKALKEISEINVDSARYRELAIEGMRSPNLNDPTVAVWK